MIIPVLILRLAMPEDYMDPMWADEELHGYAGMHDIAPVLKKQHSDDPKDVLKQHYGTFCQPEFWLDRPRTTTRAA